MFKYLSVFAVLLIASSALAFSTNEGTVSTGSNSQSYPYHPLPYDVLYSQPESSPQNICSSQYDTVYNLLSICADDFNMTGSGDADVWFIEAWLGGWNGSFIEPTGVNLWFYNNNGGKPTDPWTSPAYAYTAAPSDWTDEFVHNQGSGYAYLFHFTLTSPLTMPKGTTLWFGAQEICDFPPQTGVVGQTKAVGSEMCFCSPYFGYPNWVTGSSVFGSQYDMAFILYGYNTGMQSSSLGQVKALFN